MPSEMPWSVPTNQVQGRKDEKAKAKKLGARLHPASGARAIKNDFSTDEIIYEDKNVARSHTLSGEKLNEQLLNAMKQGKEAHYIVYFKDFDVTLEGVLRRGA